jgi:Uma2 family endonuclease
MVITTSPLVKTYTLQEFWDLPEPKDRSKLELIKGVLYMTPPPDYPHNQAVANLDDILRAEIKRCGYRGQVYVPRAALWIDDNTYLEPDLMYISAELKAQMAPEHWTRADIVVEVISPSNASYDRKTKSDTYQAMGIREMWLIDTDKKEVEIRAFESGKNVLCQTGHAVRSEILSNIKIAVSNLFA